MRTSKEGPNFRGQTKQKTGREKSHKERVLGKLEGLKTIYMYLIYTVAACQICIIF